MRPQSRRRDKKRLGDFLVMSTSDSLEERKVILFSITVRVGIREQV